MRDRGGLALLVSVALAWGAAGCDGEGGGEACEGLAAACTTAGASRCDGAEVERCGEDAHGCLVWQLASTCGGGRACEESGSAASCVCDHQCASEGQTTCEGETLTTCVEDRDGCRMSVASVDCSSFGASCVELTGGAECAVLPCEDECETEGEASCEGETIVECRYGADGCLDLVTTVDCGADGRLCDDSSGTPACVERPGCGACDAPGEYCDATSEPPACVVAGTVAEILAGREPGVSWDDLDEMTRTALRARAELTFAAYREEFGPEALAGAVAAMRGSPTAAMTASYVAFLGALFGVDAVASSALDSILREIYVAFFFTQQVMAPNYYYTDYVTWDGATPIVWMPSPEARSAEAYRELGAELAARCQVLRRDPAASLTAADRQVLEAATAMARQLRSGSLGYYFGDRTLSQVAGLLGWGWDFMLAYHAWGGAIFESDEAFLDQVNAYYFADLVRVHEATAVALGFMHGGVFDPFYVEMLVGELETSRTAQLYVVLGDLFRDRVLAHPGIDRACYPYSPSELASIWDGFTADQGTDNDGLTTIASYRDQFLATAAFRTSRTERAMVEGLRSLFPADGAAMSLAEREAIIAAVEAADGFGGAIRALRGGLAAAGDGTAPALLEARVAAVPTVGGRDYEDADHGAEWLAEDAAAVQSMWDEVRAWVLTEYAVAAAALPEDVTPVPDDDSYWVLPGDLVVGLAAPQAVAVVYRELLRHASLLVGEAGGMAWARPAALGMASSVVWLGVADRFLEDVLDADGLADLPFVALAGLDEMAGDLGGRDGAIRQFLGECGPEGVVARTRGHVFDEWGVPEELRDLELGFAMLGIWDLSPSYSADTYSSHVSRLQERADAEHGPGAVRVDAFVLQACGLYDPRPDDATYTALESCLGL